MAQINITNQLSENNLIVFDSDCPFCSKQIRFIHKYNKNNQFYYIPRTSLAGQKIRKISNLQNLESLLLINKSTIFTESDAVINLFKLLPYPYRIVFLLGKITPRIISDIIYRIIAKIRQAIPIKQCTFDNSIKKYILEELP